MDTFIDRGRLIRDSAKKLVIEFMLSNPICSTESNGLSQSDIFRECGFNFGNKQNSNSSSQQFWVVALLRELEEENKIERISNRGKWRLKV